MDALNVLNVPPKVGGMVAFILEQNTGHLVSNKVRGLYIVISRKEVVSVQRSCHDR